MRPRGRNAQRASLRRELLRLAALADSGALDGARVVLDREGRLRALPSVRGERDERALRAVLRLLAAIGDGRGIEVAARETCATLGLRAPRDAAVMLAAMTLDEEKKR